MDLKKIHPDFTSVSSEKGVQEILRNVFMQTNFIPGVRHAIGWRGLKDSSLLTDAWTARIKGINGIYALSFNEVQNEGTWTTGSFFLYYFPHPDEDLVESFSVPAIVCTQDETYYNSVREFMLNPELCHLFNIGMISIAVNHTDESVILRLEALNFLRIIASDGLTVTRDGSVMTAVEPGGIDQDFPAWQTALPFFSVIASSFTFLLEEPPEYLEELYRPGTIRSYDSNGTVSETISGDVEERILDLGYGAGSFRQIRNGTADCNSSFTTRTVRHRGGEIPEQYRDALWWKAHNTGNSRTLDKNILGIDSRPQLIVVTGFLGSGKTSFLQNFIEYQVQRNRFVAVIQNEIGETGIDAKLLDEEYAVTEMDEGCVCCTLAGNLKIAINRIQADFSPDFIVLETTGVANPFNLLDELDELSEVIKFDSVTTVVDGRNIAESLAQYSIAEAQVKSADIILLNKVDLLSEEEREKAEHLLRELNPSAPVIPTRKGDINPALLYDPDMDGTGVFSRNNSRGDDGHDHHHHSHEDDWYDHGDNEHHGHHTHIHDELASVKIDLPEQLDRERFLGILATLPGGIFRIKGIVRFNDNDRPLLLQYVAGRYELSEYGNAGFDESFLIVIGKHPDREALTKKFLSAV